MNVALDPGSIPGISTFEYPQAIGLRIFLFNYETPDCKEQPGVSF